MTNAPSPSAPRWRRRKAARPSEIIAAALAVFAEKGFAAARLDEIEMDEVVLALEGSVAPMDCFVTLPTERVSCSHEGDAGRACSTRLLWMRVQGSVIRALQGTTLAELVEFAGRHEREAEAAPA